MLTTIGVTTVIKSKDNKEFVPALIAFFRHYACLTSHINAKNISYTNTRLNETFGIVTA